MDMFSIVTSLERDETGAVEIDGVVEGRDEVEGEVEGGVESVSIGDDVAFIVMLSPLPLGFVVGIIDGELEGLVDGILDGIVDGLVNGLVNGKLEGTYDCILVGEEVNLLEEYPVGIIGCTVGIGEGATLLAPMT